MSGPSPPLPSASSPRGGERLTPGGSVLSTCSAAASLARSCSHTGRVSSRRSRRLTVRPGRCDPPVCTPPAPGTSYRGAWAGLAGRGEAGAPDLSRVLPNRLPLLCPGTDPARVPHLPHHPTRAALPTSLTFLSPGAQKRSWLGRGLREGLFLAPRGFPWLGAPPVSPGTQRSQPPRREHSHSQW